MTNNTKGGNKRGRAKYEAKTSAKAKKVASKIIKKPLQIVGHAYASVNTDKTTHSN